MKTEMLAIIGKDLRGIVNNRRMLLTLLIVPLVLTVLIPTVFVLVIYFIPSEAADLQRLLPAEKGEAAFEAEAIRLVFNYMLPVFFLIIPTMAASIMSASSFVGEKEKHTLETLLYCPLPLRQIFRAKVLASFFLSMIVSFVSFAAMLLVLESEIFFFAGAFLVPDIRWLPVMLLLSPAISMIAITLIVRLSAKAQSVEDAQQGAAFLLIPILLLLAGQFTGVLLISTWVLLGLGGLCALLAFLLMKKAMGRFTYELLMK